MEENAARGERVKYKMTVEQALEQGDDWWAEKIGLRDYNKIAQNEEQLYTQGDILQNFDLANKESEALAKKQKEQQAEADRIFMEPGATGDKVLENFDQIQIRSNQSYLHNAYSSLLEITPFLKISALDPQQ